MLQILKKDQLSDEDIIEWKILWSKEESATYFNSYDWYIACKQTMFPNIEVWFVYQDGEFIAVVPLDSEKFSKIQCLVTYGQPYTDKSTILIKKNYLKLMPNIMQNLSKEKPVVLTEIEESQCIGFLPDTLHEIACANPYIDLNQDIMQQVKKYEWNKLKRKIDKMDFNFVVYQGEQASQHIDTVFKIEELSNKIKRSRGLFISETIRDLYRKVSESPETIIALLLDDDKAIACILGFYCKEKYFLLHNWSYDEAYQKEAPGRLILFMILQYLIERNCIKFDFSRGVSIIKKHFSTYSENNYCLYYSAKKIYLLWFRIVIALNKNHYLYKCYLKLKLKMLKISGDVVKYTELANRITMLDNEGD